MLICNIGDKPINCFDGTYSRETLKEWSKKGILKCPCCNDQVVYHHGKIMSPYFKHVSSNCNVFGEPESDEHIRGKLDLYNWIKEMDKVSEVELEGWIPETKQRPDIMFKYNNNPYVIEYQCSPIASEYIKRHELYNAYGIRDIWICGTEKYLGKNKKLNTLEKIYHMYYDADKKLFYRTDKISEKTFKNIKKNKQYIQIKDVLNSYKKYNTSLIYTENYSYASYHKLQELKFVDIIRFGVFR